ncbi:protein FAM133A-like [Penaeus japonicus]|uniref:protein FAM133A-like n=1 Tax=Penaeus japonicus TaxID=27405 RepID=UPI001C71335E|nr:protein FAM133A-like [Penaeus japonicus]
MEQHVNQYLRNPAHSRLTLADYIQLKRREKNILKRFDLARDQIEVKDPELFRSLLQLKEDHERQEALAGRIKYHPNVLKSVHGEVTEDEDVEELQLPQDPPKRRFNFKPRLNMVWQQRLEASRKEKERKAEEAKKAQERKKRKKKKGMKKMKEKRERPTTPAASTPKPKLHETLRDRAFEAILNRLFRRQWVATMVSPVPGETYSSDDSQLPTSERLERETLTSPVKRRTSYPPSYPELEARNAVHKPAKGNANATSTMCNRDSGNHMQAATEQVRLVDIFSLILTYLFIYFFCLF